MMSRNDDDVIDIGKYDFHSVLLHLMLSDANRIANTVCIRTDISPKKCDSHRQLFQT